MVVTDDGRVSQPESLVADNGRAGLPRQGYWSTRIATVRINGVLVAASITVMIGICWISN
jgi:hypothetical protein